MSKHENSTLKKLTQSPTLWEDAEINCDFLKQQLEQFQQYSAQAFDDGQMQVP